MDHTRTVPPRGCAIPKLQPPQHHVILPACFGNRAVPGALWCCCITVPEGATPGISRISSAGEWDHWWQWRPQTRLPHSPGSGGGASTSRPTSTPPAHAGLTPTCSCCWVKQERIIHPPKGAACCQVLPLRAPHVLLSSRIWGREGGVGEGIVMGDVDVSGLFLCL